jgi:xanthine dehydrogenase small subunit
VAVLEADRRGGQRYRAVNSCLLLLPMLQGKHVYTVEGIKDDAGYHPAQQVLAEKIGSQCGYCTPGIVMSLFEGCYRDDLDEPWKVDAQMCGNLCRCTGYRPIRDAAKALAGTCPKDRFADLARTEPPEAMSLAYEARAQRFFTPDSLEALWPWLAAHPAARPVVGGTDLSLEITKRYAEPPELFSLEGIASLRTLAEQGGVLAIGACVTVSDLEDFTRERLPALERMVRYFGARQIKNRATVGGNLCNASPIGDLAPVFLALEATAIAVSAKGERRIPFDDFFVSYRKTALLPGEVLARVEVPLPHPDVRVGAYKVSKRRELDISAVAGCFAVTVDVHGQVVGARLAFGGMAATPARALEAEQALLGTHWNEENVEHAAHALADDFQPLSDHRGSSAYRMKVAQNLLRGFYAETLEVRTSRLPHPHTATVQAS